MEQTLPHSLQKEPTLPMLLFWPSSFQNCEAIHFCLSHPRKPVHPLSFTLPPRRSDAVDRSDSRTLIELLG